MNIVIAGDVFMGGDIHYKRPSIFSDVFNNADLRIVNLEHAISNNNFIENKCTLYADKDCVEAIRSYWT